MRYALLAIVLTLLGCNRDPSGSAAGPSGEVVLYSSIDEPYLRPFIKRFEKESGLTVRIVTDTEATKSAGLAERLIAEKDRPQADVYWGNEPFHAINMAPQGVFAPYRPKSAEDVPAKWREAGDLYTCIGLRARMIVVSNRANAPEKIAGLNDLTDPALKGKICMAHPAFGTTSGHMAALYVVWGEAKFTAWLKGLRGNDIKLLGGNSEVVKQVAAGTMLAGLTDNDDVNNIKSEGGAVEGVLPDQGEAGIGTLAVPGAVALIRNPPHTDNAKKLIDFICDPAVEKELIAANFAAFSVRDTAGVKTMEVDYTKVAGEMKKAIELALTILQERKP